MTFAALKEKLHDYIDHADEKKVKAIFTLVAEDLDDNEYTFDDTTLNMLEERREEYLSNNTKGYSVEESMEHIKIELKKRGL